jgi:hypothetical protein
MRLERLYDLARIVRVDHLLGDNQEVMLKKLCLESVSLQKCRRGCS